MAQLQPLETFPQVITEQDFNFLQQIDDGLACDPDKRDALIALFTDTGQRAITDVQHVVDRAEHLLQGHPHLVAQFYDLVDPVRKGLEFVKRAEKAMSPANYDRFVAKLYSVKEEESLDAHQVYREFKEVFGEKHDDLLRGLAEFLPTKYDPQPPRASAKAERKEHRRRPERKHPSYAGADDAPESSRASRAKKPRAVDVDVGPTPEPACFAGTSAAGSSRPSRARRPRMYDEHEYEYDDSWPEPERKPASCDAVSVSKSSRPSRANKPRVDDSKSRHGARACPRVDLACTGGGAVGGSVPVAAAAAPKPDASAGEVKRFREAWEFETGYSLLHATRKRAEEAKAERERLNGARASLDELFPSPEIRGYLAKMYSDQWNHMRQLLEHGGDYTAFALEAIVKRLERKDAEAVDEARRRQDPARVAQRLQELAQDRVRVV